MSLGRSREKQRASVGEIVTLYDGLAGHGKIQPRVRLRLAELSSLFSLQSLMDQTLRPSPVGLSPLGLAPAGLISPIF